MGLLPSRSSTTLGFLVDDLTSILECIEEGDPTAAAQLLPLVYSELRRLAAEKMARERPGQTLEATALVHEVYLRLVAGNGTSLAQSGSFLCCAAEAMRRILIERAVIRRVRRWW